MAIRSPYSVHGVAVMVLAASSTHVDLLYFHSLLVLLLQLVLLLPLPFKYTLASTAD